MFSRRALSAKDRTQGGLLPQETEESVYCYFRGRSELPRLRAICRSRALSAKNSPAVRAPTERPERAQSATYVQPGDAGSESRVREGNQRVVRRPLNDIPVSAASIRECHRRIQMACGPPPASKQNHRSAIHNCLAKENPAEAGFSLEV